MPNVNREWVVKQLKENRVPLNVEAALVPLLTAWSEIKEESVDVQKKAVQLFSKLAMGQPISTPKKANENWIQASPGFIKVGDEVMVRPDAFSGELAPIHNGRRGRVVAVRYGDIIVNSTDGQTPELNGTHYSPMHLLKLVK